MRKLIEYQGADSLVKCDNPSCDYMVPVESTTSTDFKQIMDTQMIALLEYVNKPCPKCGENLCTPEDYLLAKKTARFVNWLNRWFSWLTIFTTKNTKGVNMSVHCHKEINIKVKDEA